MSSIECVCVLYFHCPLTFPNLHLPGQVALNNAVGSVLHQLVSSLSNFYVYCLPHLGTMM